MKGFKSLITVLIIGLFAVSCGSTVINDAKLSLASKAKDAVKKELTEAFSELEVEGIDCNVEAEKHSIKIYDKVVSFLKAEENESGLIVSASTDKSFDPLLQGACSFVVNEGIPYLFTGDDNKCLKKLGTVQLTSLGSKVCENISL